MKRIVASLLSMILVICLFPVRTYAAEQEFVEIVIEHNYTDKQLSVIEIGENLLFSGEDLASLGYFEYRIEENIAYFTRGIKVLHVDMKKSRLYPYIGNTKVGEIKLTEKVMQIDGVYYFSGAEMLPWLNVTCNETEGKLCITADVLSIWEVVQDFDPDEFSFDLVDCCEELGVNSKYLKAAAYLHGKGISGVFWDVVPVLGTYVEYLELFEDIIQDNSSVDPAVEELLDNSEKVDYWMEIATEIDPDATYPNELQLLRSIASTLTALSDGIELAMYFTAICEHNDDVCNALLSMEVNGQKYGLPEEAITALVDVRYDYEDFSAAVGRKVASLGVDVVADKVADKATGMLNIALDLLGLAEITSPDWAEGVNRIDKYNAIASYCKNAYQSTLKTTKTISLSDVRDIRGLAFMYLYACEQNWQTMADYAAEKGQTDLQNKYSSIAASAEEWQGRFLAAAKAAVNDSHEYGDVAGSMKQSYSDSIKKVFGSIVKQPNGTGGYAIEDLVTINKTVCTCNWNSEEWFFSIPQINLDSAEIDAINAEIMSDYSEVIHDCNASDSDIYLPYCYVNCDYTVTGEILSLIIEGWHSDCDGSNYSVYNISLSEKVPVDDKTLIAVAGMTESEYRTHVKQALGSVFWNCCGYLSDVKQADYTLDEWRMYDGMLQNTIGAENVNAAEPFLGENGDLWVVGDVYIPAGGGIMTITVNLNEYEMAPNYAESLEYEKYEERILPDGTYNVSFSSEDFKLDEGKIFLAFGYYEYDTIEKTDALNMRIGDSIRYNNEVIIIDSIDFDSWYYYDIEMHSISINDGEAYFQTDVRNPSLMAEFDDTALYPLFHYVGEVRMEVNPSAVFYHETDPYEDANRIPYDALLDYVASSYSGAYEQATTVKVKDGVITEIYQAWIP